MAKISHYYIINLSTNLITKKQTSTRAILDTQFEINNLFLSERASRLRRPVDLNQKPTVIFSTLP